MGVATTKREEQLPIAFRVTRPGWGGVGESVFSCAPARLQRALSFDAAAPPLAAPSYSLHHAPQPLDAVQKQVALLDDRLVERAFHIRPVCLQHASHLRRAVKEARQRRAGAAVQDGTRALSILQFSRPAAMKSDSSPSRKAGDTPNADAIICSVTLLYDSRNYAHAHGAGRRGR
jgi:hypothetical protein